MKYTVSNIKYDTDGEEVDLSETLEIEVPDDIQKPEEIINFLSDEISNITGFCHQGFTTSPIL